MTSSNHKIDLDPLLRRYCEDHSDAGNGALIEVERSTHLNTVKRHDASDMIQGRLISFISHLCRPRLIVEIGTFTAYATGCLAEGLVDDGHIISIEQNESYLDMIEENLNKLGHRDRVDLRMGNALDILPDIEDTIDLLFIDAAKHEYEAYFDLTIDKIRKGGVILTDNTIWKGRILNNQKDKMTQSVHDFNKKMINDARVDVVILPYRDGISFIRKK